MALKVIIIGILAIGVLSVLISMYKSKHFIKVFFLTAFQGLAAMFAVNVIGLISGVTIALNWFTISTVSLFGIPSCIAFTILNILMK